jgi:hypothetical protein
MPKVLKTRNNASTGAIIYDKVSDIVAPTVTQDSGDGFVVGSQWDLVDSTGAVLTSYILADATVGAAVWRQLDTSINPLWDVQSIEEVIALNGSASNNLVNQLPAGAIPLCAVMNYDAPVVLATAVKIGLGTSGSIVGIGLTDTTVTKNHKNRLAGGALCNVPVQAATPLQLKACATDGTAAGTMTSGSVHVRVLFALPTDLPNAA